MPYELPITGTAPDQAASKTAHEAAVNAAIAAAVAGRATAAQGEKADTAIQPGNAALSDAREWTAATVGQAEAEEGTATTRRAWTAQRVRQAAAAWWAASSAKTTLDTAVSAISALSTSLGTLSTRVDSIAVNDVTRPGENPEQFSSALTGAPDTRPVITAGSAVVNTAIGHRVWRVTGTDVDGGIGYVDVAPRRAYAMDPGRVYRVRMGFARAVDPVDPANNAVEVRVQNLSSTKAHVSNVSPFDDPFTPVTDDGLVVVEFTVSRDVAGDHYPPPSASRHLVPFLRIYGNAQSTDAVFTEWADITDIQLGGADVAALTTRVANEELAREAGDTANADALAAHIATKGAANGFASLDAAALVPAAQLPIADQGEAETGTSTAKVMTPARATQHFNFRVGAWLRESGFLSALDRAEARSSLNLTYSDQELAEAGTAASLVMSPQRTTQHFNARVGTWVRTSGLLNSVSADAFLAALGGGQSAAIAAGDDAVRAIAALADSRAQAAGASADLQRDQLSLILARLAAAESTITQLFSEAESQMTTYSIAATVGTTASVIVPSADVQRLQILNKSDDATVGIAFGTSPGSMTAPGLLTLAPGAALDTPLIAGVPIYAIASAADAPIVGAFSVPRGNPNPLWETDFQALIAGMATAPVYAWEEAYRRLYSALRREGILARTRGLFIPVAHGETAARQNWAAPGTYMTAVGEPAFIPGVGFDYDGIDDAHNTGLMLNGWTTSLDLAAIVWTAADDQLTGRVAMGDGATAIQANRSPTLAALNTGTTNSDVVSIPYLGGILGFTRTREDRATVLRPGGRNTTVFRARIMTLPGRNMHIGADNASAGVGSFYDGVIKAGYFGRSLTDRQSLAFEVAMNDFFAAATAAQAGV